MSEIRVVRPHHTTLKKARKGAEHIAEELGEEFGLDHEWDGDTLRFQRMGKGLLCKKSPAPQVAPKGFPLGNPNKLYSRPSH